MSIKVLDFQYDSKLSAFSLMTLMTIDNYLSLTDESEENLEIQRKIISTRKSKVYERLIEDLKTGCIIPPIVLVLRNNHDNISNELDRDLPDKQVLSELLSKSKSNDISILDGLQRTNCLRRACGELAFEADRLAEFLSREIRVEFWVDIRFQAILYRMITLNAGQTPMSLKHQLEVINLHLLESIKQSRPDIEIYTSRDGKKRTRAKQYQFSTLVDGYNAFISRSPITDPKNDVIEELNRISFLNTFINDGNKIDVERFIHTIVNLDEVICDRYQIIPNGDEGSIQKGQQLLGKEPYFIGICAALGRASHHLDSESFKNRIDSLMDFIANSQELDPLQLGLLNDLVKSIPASSKVGDIQRQLTADVFEQHLILGTDFLAAWMYAGSKVRSK